MLRVELSDYAQVELRALGKRLVSLGIRISTDPNLWSGGEVAPTHTSISTHSDTERRYTNRQPSVSTPHSNAFLELSQVEAHPTPRPRPAKCTTARGFIRSHHCTLLNGIETCINLGPFSCLHPVSAHSLIAHSFCTQFDC